MRARSMTCSLHWSRVALGTDDGQAQRHGEIENFRHGQVAVERAELRQVADGEGKLLPQRFHRMPGQQNAARGDRLDAGQGAQQRAFAAARRADDGEERALRHGEGNIAQQRLVIVALADHHARGSRRK